MRQGTHPQGTGHRPRTTARTHGAQAIGVRFLPPLTPSPRTGRAPGDPVPASTARLIGSKLQGQRVRRGKRHVPETTGVRLGKKRRIIRNPDPSPPALGCRLSQQQQPPAPPGGFVGPQPPRAAQPCSPYGNQTNTLARALTNAAGCPAPSGRSGGAGRGPTAAVVPRHLANHEEDGGRVGTSRARGPPRARPGWEIAAQLHAGSGEGFLNLLLQGKILQKAAGIPRKSWGQAASPTRRRKPAPGVPTPRVQAPKWLWGSPRHGWRASTSTLWGEDEFPPGFHHLHPTSTPTAAPGLHLLLPRAGNLKESLQEGFRGRSPSRRGAGAFGAVVTDSPAAPATRRREGKAEGGILWAPTEQAEDLAG